MEVGKFSTFVIFLGKKINGVAELPVFGTSVTEGVVFIPASFHVPPGGKHFLVDFVFLGTTSQEGNFLPSLARPGCRSIHSAVLSAFLCRGSRDRQAV